MSFTPTSLLVYDLEQTLNRLRREDTAVVVLICVSSLPEVTHTPMLHVEILAIKKSLLRIRALHASSAVGNGCMKGADGRHLRFLSDALVPRGASMVIRRKCGRSVRCFLGSTDDLTPRVIDLWLVSKHAKKHGPSSSMVHMCLAEAAKTVGSLWACCWVILTLKAVTCLDCAFLSRFWFWFWLEAFADIPWTKLCSLWT